MKILYLFDQSVGLDSRAQKEIAAFARNGHDILVCEWNKDEKYNPRQEKLFVRGIEVKCLSIGVPVKRGTGIRQNFLALAKYEKWLWRFLRKNVREYDLLYCVNLDTAFIASLVSGLQRKVFIYDVFDDYADAHQCGGVLYWLIKRLDYRVMKNAKKVILCSEKRVKQIRGKLDHYEIVYNTPDIFPVREHESGNAFKIAYVGNLSKGRYLEELLSIAATHPEWNLECGGDGELAEVVAQYSEKHENIHYHGVMKYEDVIDLESRCDVIPALYNPEIKNNIYAAPNKVFEAMSLGKPTIMVKNTGMDDFVIKNDMGIVITGDPTSLEKALKSISRNKAGWADQAQRLKALYKENYGWERMEKRLTKIIQTGKMERDG